MLNIYEKMNINRNVSRQINYLLDDTYLKNVLFKTEYILLISLS